MQAHRLANTNGVIFLSAYEITGTANFSQIMSAITNLQSSLNGIKAPTITPQINMSGAGGVMSGLKGSLMSEAGNFANVGQAIGQNLTMGMTSQFGMAGNVAGSLVTALGPVGIAAGVAGAGLLAVGGAAVSTAANWETLMASVSKTTGIEGAGLDKLSSDLQNIRMQTGATAEEISNAVTTAGSIGIPTEELASFTEVAMQMGSAFGMSAEAASEAMGKIGNVVKPAEMSWTEFSTKAGSAVNDLADSMATSEAEILTGMTHLGATMALLKPPADTIPAWTAMVATVQSLGLAGDQAGEAIQDALQYATKDLKGGISGLLGMTKEELQINLRTNAPEVMQEAAAAIAALPLEQQGEALAKFGQTGQKAIALLMGDLDPASGKFEKLGDAIDTANKGWEEGTSLSEAYGKAQETFNASIDRLYASLDVAGQILGTVFLPLLADGIDLLTSGVQAAIGFGSAVSELFSSDLGGIFGTNKEDMYQDIVDKKRAAEAGEKTGDAMAEGIKESDALAKAPGETLGSDAASAEVKKSAEELAKNFAEEFSTTMQDQAIDKAISQAASRAGNENINRNKGNVAGFASTTLENGLNVDIAYQGRGDKIMSRLFIDGQQIGGEVWGTREEGIRQLLKNWHHDQGNVYELMDEPGNAAIWRSSQHVTHIADYIFAPDTVIKAKVDELYKSIDSALADGKLTRGKNSEQTDLLGLVQDLDWLKKYYPEEYAKIGGESIEALNDALRKGDIKKVMEELGKIGGDSFLNALNVSLDKKEVDWSKIFAGDTKGIADVREFGANVFQPEMIKYAKQALDLYNTSLDENRLSAQDLVEAYSKLLDIAPELFSSEMIAALNEYTGDLESVGPTLQKIVDAAKETKEELKEVFTGQGGGLYSGEFVDPRANWQDFLTPEGGYVGPTELWAQRQMEIEERNQQISASLAELESMKHPLEFEATVDTAPAIDDITALEEQIVGTEASITITADTRIAEDRWMNLVNVIQTTPVVVPLTVAVNASEVRSMVRSAIADAIASA